MIEKVGLPLSCLVASEKLMSLQQLPLRGLKCVAQTVIFRFYNIIYC